MRATDGRPYELKSVPTKTVAIRTTGNCSDLVQNLCLHPVGNGLAHSVCQTLVGTKIHSVGAGIARPFLTVSSASSGRADAKDVSALSFMRLC